MRSFLGGWFDISPGRHDEIEGIGKLVLFPLEFVNELLEDVKDDVRELKKSPEARLESLERRYQYEGIKSKEVKKRQAKLQKFILANKEKVKERLEQYRQDFQNRAEKLAYEGIYQILESKTYGRFQSMIDENKEKDFMKPKVIRLQDKPEKDKPEHEFIPEITR